MSDSCTTDGRDLLTDRLRLRGWPPADTAAVNRDERLPHWAEDFPADGDRVIAGFIEAHPASCGECGQRQIIERATGLVVGSIGLFWPPSDGTVEFGYGVVPSRRGRGYAPEAVRALVAFALSSAYVDEVQAEVEAANRASVRVLEKAGLHPAGTRGETVRFRTGPLRGTDGRYEQSGR
ncbi:Protein N-acetyltransferase, RimJ/RimL family [Streptomyces sp. WMMB 714]|uniref:GNAT family N-acetyltransferase n=1 Tax=Streptomyces sp. WMMB 714 TaxID=1286822 RepID=UPI0005F8126B|nr:GNAT family N-acetyltransferase [Streptomyces sp. WMMB 714]SCK55379.1 Protein N-acetyltransferase, RimJ/RimL family [Streptomyces sp. WMMB 714]